MWRGELRLLFKAHHPVGRQQEHLALVKYFVSAGGGATGAPSVLTHVYDVAARPTPADGEARGSSSSRGRQRAHGEGSSSTGRSAPVPRRSATGRYTGSVRIRFSADHGFRKRYAVMPIHNLIRAEHVLTDYLKRGLSGAFESFYVNPWKFAPENVGDDDGRGEKLNIAPL